MSLYRITADKLDPVPTTTFATEKLMERRDLQRLLRQDISVLGDDLMVIAEEYGDWEDCNRRIDLLCLSRDGCLVVVEIKRTEDGGHMELQAIRYAAIEAAFGESLDWRELPGRNSCRICREVADGWRTPEADWPDLQDRMIDAPVRQDGALRKPVQDLSV